jgi:hypothetical protein
MKKRIFLTLACLLIPSIALATVGSVAIAQKRIQIADSHPANEIRQLIFTCVGDVGDGSIPDTTISKDDMNFIRGWCLTKVEAYQTTVGVGADADEASIFILDSEGMDLLGSEDGGTTPYAGRYMIHATLKRMCFLNAYLPRIGLHTNYYDAITNYLTLRVIDQATPSADWTIVLTFQKQNGGK